MRHIFIEIGKTENEINVKLNNAFKQLFEGDAQNERVCFDTKDGLSYIVDIGHDDIRSEGMSYAMLIAALLKKRALFDRLWAFSKRYLRNDNGPWASYFAWQVSTKDFSKLDKGAAPDGEEYFAMALLYAAKIFNSFTYKHDALEIINAMAHKEECEHVCTMMDKTKLLPRFSPAKGNDFTDASYHTIAFYKKFEEESNDPIWRLFRENSLAYLKKALHKDTGLSSDYSEFDGTPKSTPWFLESNRFSGDAWRVIWNIALDAALVQDKKAMDFEISSVEKILRFFHLNRPYKADYFVDGIPCENARAATTGLIAMNAAATIAIPKDSPFLFPFANDLWNEKIPTGKWRYYDGMLYMIGLLACSGKFF